MPIIGHCTRVENLLIYLKYRAKEGESFQFQNLTFDCNPIQLVAEGESVYPITKVSNFRR
jgi:hypothetical protein